MAGLVLETTSKFKYSGASAGSIIVKPIENVSGLFLHTCNLQSTQFVSFLTRTIRFGTMKLLLCSHFVLITVVITFYFGKKKIELGTVCLNVRHWLSSNKTTDMYPVPFSEILQYYCWLAIVRSVGCVVPLSSCLNLDWYHTLMKILMMRWRNKMKKVNLCCVALWKGSVKGCETKAEASFKVENEW